MKRIFLTILLVAIYLSAFVGCSNDEFSAPITVEYNDCCYQIRSMGNSEESVFWDNLNALLGN